MKRISAILSVCLLVIMLSAVPGFAGNLQVDLSNPKDGDTGMAKDNLGVKLYFNQDMYSKKYNKANEKCFSITDEKWQRNSDYRSIQQRERIRKPGACS